MNIVLVTPLYPSYPGQPRREVTYALHYFAQQWIKSPNTRVVVAIPSKRIRIRKRQFDFSGLIEHSIDGIPVARTPLFNIPGTDYLSVATIKRYLANKAFSPDIIVAHTSTGAEAAALLARKLQVPAIYAVHNCDFSSHATIRRLVPKFDAVVFRSSQIETTFLQHHLAPQMTFVANSGIESHLIIPKKEYLGKLVSNPLRILSVGALIALKNIDLVLAALAALPKAANWSYTIVGDGPERQRLESLVNQLHLRPRVSFLGELPRDECLALMSSHHVFALISKPETFGLVYLEAMAKGLIVIGTRGTGIDGVIKDGFNGYLRRPGATDELVALLNTLSNAPDLSTIRKNAYRTIHDYTIEKRASDYAAFLHKVIDATAQKPGPPRNSQRSQSNHAFRVDRHQNGTQPEPTQATR